MPLQQVVHPLEHLAQPLDHQFLPAVSLGSGYQHRPMATEPKLGAATSAALAQRAIRHRVIRTIGA